MKLYVYKDDNNNLQQPALLPAKYRGFTDEELATFGYFLPVFNIVEQSSQTVSHYELEEVGKVITATPILRQKTEEEIGREEEQALSITIAKKEAGTTLGADQVETDLRSAVEALAEWAACQVDPERVGTVSATGVDVADAVTAIANHYKNCDEIMETAKGKSVK